MRICSKHQTEDIMTMLDTASSDSTRQWLKRYYAIRAAGSTAWVAAALLIGPASTPGSIALLLAYPAWDCLANLYDARRNGGLGANPTQAINALVSAAVTAAVAITASRGLHLVIGVIGVWAILAGLLQLATAIRRWRSVGAQWPMVLSGAQSSLAGAFFIKQAANAAVQLGVAAIAGYAAFGAIYFAISAIALAISPRRKASHLS
jgi:hypothetical protein